MLAGFLVPYSVMGKPLKKSQVVNNSPVAQSHTLTYLYTSDKPNAATVLGNYDIPANWPRPPLHNPPGSVPGPPVVYAPPVDPDDVAPGYRFSMPVPMREDHIFLYHTDHLGSTSYITDGEGIITQFVCYMPFGQAFVDVHTTRPEMPFKFNGKELDTETGLYYFGARYYDPMTALWYGVDPLAEKMPWVSSYVFCFNNPVNFVDPDGREPITLGILALRAAIGGAIGAGIDITVQMTANMTLKNQGFLAAAKSIDWTSVGASAVTGAVGVPGANVISKTAKVATIATAVAVDAAVDVSITEGNKNIFNREKYLTEAGIDVVGSLIGGKASDGIVKGAKNSISNDISSGAFSTLNKAEKNTLLQTQRVVNSQGFETGIETTVGLVNTVGNHGAERIIGSGNPSGAAIPIPLNHTQPSDNTRVARPIYTLP